MWSARASAALVATFIVVGFVTIELLNRAGQSYVVATIGGILAGGIALAAGVLFLGARSRRRDRRGNRTPPPSAG